jgi:hypothetical protein
MGEPVSAARIVERLDSARETGPSTWRAHCPACDSNSNCLSIRETDDGRVLLHCFRDQCEPAAIVEAIGVSMAELFPPRLDQHRYPPIRSLMPAREALALVDFELIVATLILEEALRERKFTRQQLERLRLCSSRINHARNKSCPARMPKGAA